MKTSLLVLFATGLFLTLTAGSCMQGKHVTGSKNYITKKVEVGHSKRLNYRVVPMSRITKVLKIT